ncbi:MAG: TIGR02757 family protein [Thermodesulfobacteriota bacterium]|nr:TIGR02757 family protein [Thermodesulfobacteriota bacterium]
MICKPIHSDIAEIFESLYTRYNKREFVHPDPLEFLYKYDDLGDREVVGLIASSLAYGRVTQILKSVSSVLSVLQPTPTVFLQQSSRKSLQHTFQNFKYRFTTDTDISDLLFGIKCIIERYGSLYACFLANMNTNDETILTALSAFAEELTSTRDITYCSLLPSPMRGSACKRMNLFMRWMVKHNEVDPGGWDKISTSKLIVPLDTHLLRICRTLNLTKRKHADMRTALEITAAFRTIAPSDPVRYDFALTRLGIRKDINSELFFQHITQSQKNDDTF